MKKSKWTLVCEELRHIPLEYVLKSKGAQQDTHDRKKWHTIQGPVSITGPKFFNWQRGCGGGGAIDLVMHLNGCGFAAAITYLGSLSSSHYIHEKYLPVSKECKTIVSEEKYLLLPEKKSTEIKSVVSYLIQQRKLPAHLIYPAIESGHIYADKNANAVFLMQGKYKTVVGAEIRGTTQKKWRGLATGSNRHKGAFAIGNSRTKRVALCESAIDAISYVDLFPDTLAISTAGAIPYLKWIDKFIKQGFLITCAFDNDDTGNKMAKEMMRRYPEIKRQKPNKAHDWNDILYGL